MNDGWMGACMCVHILCVHFTIKAPNILYNLFKVDTRYSKDCF